MQIIDTEDMDMTYREQYETWLRDFADDKATV